MTQMVDIKKYKIHGSTSNKWKIRCGTEENYERCKLLAFMHRVRNESDWDLVRKIYLRSKVMNY